MADKKSEGTRKRLVRDLKRQAKEGISEGMPSMQDVAKSLARKLGIG